MAIDFPSNPTDQQIQVVGSVIYTYDSSVGVWNASGIPESFAMYSRSSIVATENQTVFEVAYNIGYLIVYLNGVLLNNIDYTATNGSTITLIDPAAVDDLLEFITFNTIKISTQPATFNVTNLTSNLAITAGHSAVSVGPINIADGVSVSIASGQKWVIL